MADLFVLPGYNLVVLKMKKNELFMMKPIPNH